MEEEMKRRMGRSPHSAWEVHAPRPNCPLEGLSCKRHSPLNKGPSVQRAGAAGRDRSVHRRSPEAELYVCLTRSVTRRSRIRRAVLWVSHFLAVGSWRVCLERPSRCHGRLLWSSPVLLLHSWGATLTCLHVSFTDPPSLCALAPGG